MTVMVVCLQVCACFSETRFGPDQVRVRFLASESLGPQQRVGQVKQQTGGDDGGE
jgi:hypothetical protein